MAAVVGSERDEPVLPADFFKTSPWSFSDFHSLQEIGKGKDTVIYSAVCTRMGGRRVAVKVYDKHKVQPTKYRAIKREIAMMMYFTNKRLPHCVEYYGAFHDADHIYLVMEHCGGGDLLEKLLKDKKAMNEKKVAVEVAMPLLTILRQLHALKVIHRDIKLENIFIDDAGRIKLGDFGLTMSMKQESAISPVGTVEYMAPEVVALPPVDLVISGQIRAQDIPPTDEKVDIWALGVTLYELVTGRLPFEGKDKPEIKKNITANNLAGFPSFLTPQCQSMIRAMLAYSPGDRPSAEALLCHPYLTMYAPSPKPTGNVISLQAFTPGAAVAAGQGGGAGIPRSPALPAPPSSSSLSSSSLSSRQAAQLTYRDALAGMAPPGDPGTPRTPGGTTVGFTVQKGRPASSMATPMAHAQMGGPFYGGAGDAGDLDGREQRPPSASRKSSFSMFGSLRAASKGSAGKGGQPGQPAVDDPGRLEKSARRSLSWTNPKGYQAVSPDGRSGGSSNNMVEGIKSTLKKLFTRRPTHQRVDEDDMMQVDGGETPRSPASASPYAYQPHP